MILRNQTWSLALAALLALTCALQAGPFSTRADSQKPLGPESEKALEELAVKHLPIKREQLVTQMDWAIAQMSEVVELSEEEVAGFMEDAKSIIDDALKAWRPCYIRSLRFYVHTDKNDEARAKRVARWQAEDTVPITISVEGWKPPNLLPAWRAAVKARLGTERAERVLAEHDKKRKKVVAEMNKFLQSWASSCRQPMDDELRFQIDTVRSSLKLEQRIVDDLFVAANKLVDDHVATEIKAGRQLLESLTEDQREKTMGTRNSFSARFVRPGSAELEAKWVGIVSPIIGKDQVKLWQAAVADARLKDEQRMIDALKQNEQRVRQQIEDQMGREVDGYVAELSLNDERKAALEKLSKKALDACIDAAREGWIESIRALSAAERKSGRNRYYGISDEQMPQKLGVWLDGLKEILTDDEKQRVKDGLAARKMRMHRALAAVTLAEMDKTLGLQTEQRAKLEPLLLPLMEGLARDEGEEYWSYQPYQLFNSAGKIAEEKVRGVLDAAQMERWATLCRMTSSSSSRSAVPVNAASEPDPEAEAPDVEVEISRHLYQFGLKERARQWEIMQSHVEDAARVLKLAPGKVARLTSAAKGAVEASMEPWRAEVERWVRQTAERAAPSAVKATLANLQRTSYSNRNSRGPQAQDVWSTTVTGILSPAEMKQWNDVIVARSRYRTGAMARMTTLELDRRRRLTTEQFEKVQGLVQNVLDDYLPDIQRYMSHSWHLQYYYALLPLAGVPEADLKAALSDKQWKLVRERDLSDAEQYWSGIESYHKRRIEGGDAGISDSPLFFFDE